MTISKLWPTVALDLSLPGPNGVEDRNMKIICIKTSRRIFSPGTIT